MSHTAVPRAPHRQADSTDVARRLVGVVALLATAVTSILPMASQVVHHGPWARLGVAGRRRAAGLPAGRCCWCWRCCQSRSTATTCRPSTGGPRLLGAAADGALADRAAPTDVPLVRAGDGLAILGVDAFGMWHANWTPTPPTLADNLFAVLPLAQLLLPGGLSRPVCCHSPWFSRARRPAGAFLGRLGHRACGNQGLCRGMPPGRRASQGRSRPGPGAVRSSAAAGRRDVVAAG